MREKKVAAVRAKREKEVEQQKMVMLLAGMLAILVTMIIIHTASGSKAENETAAGAETVLAADTLQETETQIIPAYHAERMEKLHITDITNPYQNIKTGVDYMAELLERYNGSYEKALTAYRWGPTGAQQEYFSVGKTGCEYSESVIAAAGRVRKQAGYED